MSEGSKTADKILAMLMELSNGKFISPQHLAQRMGINRTVAQRLLTTLLDQDLAVRRAGEYALSPRLSLMADAVQRPLRQVIGPRLADLCAQVRETVVFAVLDGADSVVLDTHLWPRSTSIQVYAEVGSKAPATTSATGRAMLAQLPVAQLNRVALAVGEDVERLTQELAEVRRAGEAVVNDEDLDEVGALAVAVTDAERVVGAVGILVPSSRGSGLHAHRGPLERTARAIEHELASRG